MRGDRHSHFTWIFVGIVAVGLGLRLVLALTFVPTLGGDPRGYHILSASMATGEGYRGMGAWKGLRPPGWPFLLAGLYRVTGVSVMAGQIAQALLGTAIVALIGLIARRVWDRRTGLVCAGLAAVFPPLILAGSTLWAEVLFTVLVLAAVLAALRYRDGDELRWALAAGLLGGLLCLTRSNGVVVLLPLALAVWTRRPRWSWRALAPPLALLAIAAVTISPWTVRNAVVLNSFVLISTQGGFTLAGTYNDEARNDPVWPSRWRPPGGPGRDEVSKSRALTSQAVDYAISHPSYVLATGYRNSLRLLALRDLEYQSALRGPQGMGFGATGLAIMSWYPVLALAIVGACLSRARAAPRFFWAVPALLWLSAVFVQGHPRFRTPVDPYIIMLAGLGALALVDLYRPTARPHRHLRHRATTSTTNASESPASSVTTSRAK